MVPQLRVISVGAAALAFVAVGLVAIVWGATGESATISSELIAATAAGAAVATLPAVILFVLRASEAQRDANLALAAGLLVLGGVVFGVGEVGPLVADSSAGFRFIRTLGLTAAVCLFAAGLSAGAIRDRHRWLALVPVLAMIAIFLGTAIGGARPGVVLPAAGWGTLIIVFGYGFLVDRTPHLLWLTVGFVGFLFGGLAAHGQSDLWELVAGSERVLASLILIFGLGGELGRSSRLRLAQLAAAERQMQELNDVALATQRLVEEREHEARSALASIEHTAAALRHRGSLDGATVDELEAALSAELMLLRRLIALPAPAELREFPIADAIGGVVTAERVAGLIVEMSVAADLRAVGDPEATAQVVQNLLENARRHAPGSPVTVAGKVSGPWVVISVDDSGPGIAPDARGRVLRRGVDGGHPTSATGSGLGLYIAERLMREQRGFLWIGEAAGRGASVRLALPSSREEAGPPPTETKATVGGRGAAPIARA